MNLQRVLIPLSFLIRYRSKGAIFIPNDNQVKTKKFFMLKTDCVALQQNWLTRMNCTKITRSLLIIGSLGRQAGMSLMVCPKLETKCPRYIYWTLTKKKICRKKSLISTATLWLFNGFLTIRVFSIRGIRVSARFLKTKSIFMSKFIFTSWGATLTTIR